MKQVGTVHGQLAVATRDLPRIHG